MSSDGDRRSPTRSSSARARVSQLRRTELREELESPTERLRRRAALPGPPVEPAADEVRQGEVERQARRSLEIELVERSERRPDVPLRPEHERPGTRQRCSDPEAGEDPAALLEPLEHLARPPRLVERDERLDMERLAAIREHLVLTVRSLTLAHAHQRPVDGRVVARRVLDEREPGQHQRFPPGAPRHPCLLDQRHECLPRSLDPTAARVDDGPHAERHRPGSRLLHSRDHRASLLDEPLGLVPAPRAELGERDVCLPLCAPVLLAVYAVPVVLDRMTGPRLVEVVDRVEVDERYHVLPLFVPRPGLELPPLREELQPWWLAEHEAGPEPVDRHGGDRGGVALPIDRHERCVSVPDRPGRVVGDVVVDEPRVDPGELALVRRRFERRQGVLARCAKGPHHPLDLAQQEECLGARPWHVGLRRLLGTRPRGHHVADCQQRCRLAEPPPCELRGRLGRRQPRGRCVELCGCLLGSPPRSARGRGLDLRRDGVVRDRRARREVASALLGVLHHVGKQLMELSASFLGRGSVDHRREQGVGEANPLSIDDEHACLLRLDQRRPEIAVARNGPFENGPRRAREGGCGEHEVASAVRQAVEALGHEVLDAAGHRKRVADGLFVSLACERVRHLEGEERIATGDLRQPPQGRSCQGIAEARADYLVHSCE